MKGAIDMTPRQNTHKKRKSRPAPTPFRFTDWAAI